SLSGTNTTDPVNGNIIFLPNLVIGVQSGQSPTGVTAGNWILSFIQNVNITFNYTGATTFFSSIREGSVVEHDSGTTTLTGQNSYTGATRLLGGTLQAGVTGAFSPFSAFTVASGATLNLNNLSQTIGSLAGAGSVTLGTASLTTGGDNSSTTFAGTVAGG